MVKWICSECGKTSILEKTISTALYEWVCEECCKKIHSCFSTVSKNEWNPNNREAGHRNSAEHNERNPKPQSLFHHARDEVKEDLSWTVELMKACLAIHHSGLPITTELVAPLLGKNRIYLSAPLHGLGDKQCLTLVRSSESRGQGHPLQWVINPLFIKYYNGEKSEPWANQRNQNPVMGSPPKP